MTTLLSALPVIGYSGFLAPERMVPSAARVVGPPVPLVSYWQSARRVVFSPRPAARKQVDSFSPSGYNTAHSWGKRPDEENDQR